MRHAKCPTAFSAPIVIPAQDVPLGHSFLPRRQHVNRVWMVACSANLNNLVKHVAPNTLHIKADATHAILNALIVLILQTAVWIAKLDFIMWLRLELVFLVLISAPNAPVQQSASHVLQVII